MIMSPMIFVGLGDKSSVAQFVVMPVRQWWSAIEKDSLASEVEMFRVLSGKLNAVQLNCRPYRRQS